MSGSDTESAEATDGAPIVEYVGVYDADGGVVGEVRYVIGHLIGTAECALCDITHSPFRRKPQWDAMVERLGVPMRLLHRNELRDAALADAVAAAGLPVVVGRSASGWRIILDRAALERAGGSVEGFERQLRAER